jgi:prolipoprotein diacylglyceryltransferase
MLYSFELQMMGVIFSIVMLAGGISLWIKRRKIRKELENVDDEISENNNVESL